MQIFIETDLKKNFTVGNMIRSDKKGLNIIKTYFQNKI